MKRWLIRGVVLFVVLILLLLLAGWLISEPRPVGRPGPEADALARRVEAAVNAEAWREKTGAVWWNFGDRYVHLWDRNRGYARVRWDDVEVLLDIPSKTGVAKRSGREVTGTEKQALLDRAYERWVNDSFWLNPLVKLFDEGTKRAIVELEDGSEGLLITYSSGGVTPGDAYLWILGPDDLPAAWKMWVDIIPIGGLEVTWERWKNLSTGAKVATLHRGVLTLELTDVVGAQEVMAIEPEDPFAPLIAKPASLPATHPASDSAADSADR